jgi:hypothetical protein
VCLEDIDGSSVRLQRWLMAELIIDQAHLGSRPAP